MYKNGISTLDLCIVNDNFLKNFQYFKVCDLHRHLSDHCAISLCINVKYQPQNDNNSHAKTFKVPTQYKWDTVGKANFINYLNCEETVTEITNFVNDNNNLDSNERVRSLSNILQTIANKSLRKRKAFKPKNKKNKKWFDYELENMKVTIKKLSRKVSNKKASHEEVSILNANLKQYKKACKQKMNRWKQGMLEKLDNLNSADPKEAWSILNDLKNEGEQRDLTSSIEVDTWLSHYKNLNKIQNKHKELIKSYEEKIKIMEQGVARDEIYNEPVK